MSELSDLFVWGNEAGRGLLLRERGTDVEFVVLDNAQSSEERETVIVTLAAFRLQRVADYVANCEGAKVERAIRGEPAERRQDA